MHAAKFKSVVAFDAMQEMQLRSCSHIYVAQVISYKSPLVQQARLSLLLREQPIQDVKHSILIALVQGFPALSRTSETWCIMPYVVYRAIGYDSLRCQADRILDCFEKSADSRSSLLHEFQAGGWCLHCCSFDDQVGAKVL